KVILCTKLCKKLSKNVVFFKHNLAIYRQKVLRPIFRTKLENNTSNHYFTVKID
uniref:Ovule protein n=1 Tax=Strongyloides papillosus TaxID=174720 RepID=A0A0N5BT31_STREA